MNFEECKNLATWRQSRCKVLGVGKKRLTQCPLTIVNKRFSLT